MRLVNFNEITQVEGSIAKGHISLGLRVARLSISIVTLAVFSQSLATLAPNQRRAHGLGDGGDKNLNFFNLKTS